MKRKNLYLLLPVSGFSFNIAGASYKNKDGVRRQTLIQKLICGEKLFLVPEPLNKFSDHAIVVVNSKKENLGYVPDLVAGILDRTWDRGVSDCTAEVLKIVGGGADRYFGCVVVCKPKTPPTKKVSMFFDFSEKIAYVNDGKKNQKRE